MLNLFITFFKIGLFTFGGGYAMIALVDNECVDKNKWIDEKEFINLVSIAETTPGPIAINLSTYIGYKLFKIKGSIIATIAVVLPSIIIIYLISIFFKELLSYKLFNDIFYGIRIAICIIIIRTSINMIKKEYCSNNKKIITIILFLIFSICLFIKELFNINISSIFFVIFAIMLGIIVSLFNNKFSD